MLPVSAALIQLNRKEQTLSPPDYFHVRPEVEKAYGYTHAVRIGDDIKVSGAVSMDDDGNPTTVGDLEQQMKNVYADLRKVLEHYGCGFDDVVVENVFTTDMAGFHGGISGSSRVPRHDLSDAVPSWELAGGEGASATTWLSTSPAGATVCVPRCALEGKNTDAAQSLRDLAETESLDLPLAATFRRTVKGAKGTLVLTGDASVDLADLAAASVTGAWRVESATGACRKRAPARG